MKASDHVALSSTAQFLWVGGAISPIERLALASFRDNGWRTVLYSYSPIDGVPSGVDQRDGNEILSKDAIFSDPFDRKPQMHATFTTFADRFRLHLLAARGGWWFDTDMIALRPPLKDGELTPFYVASTFEGQWKTCAINCAMFCHPDDPVMIAMRDEVDTIVERANFKFGDTGPFLLQRTLRERRMEGSIAPFAEFCPFPWRQIRQAAFRTNREYTINIARVAKHLVWERTRSDFKAAYIRRGTRCVHLHNEIWRREGLCKSGPFHPRSFVGRVMRRHGIEINAS